MSWNYRIVQYPDGGGYGLHEVHYDDKGKEKNMTAEPAAFVGDTKREVIASLRMAFDDVRRQPVFKKPSEWK